MSKDQIITRKLRAILSADVKGYSLLMADDEVATINTLKDYRNIMSACIEQRGGRVVDAVGDNLLAEFESAVDAVQCAVEVQKELKDKNQNIPDDKRLEFRIGVNIGDVIEDEERIFGEGVNVAARIEGLADAGGICISRNAYDHVKNKLELKFEYLGEHKVKNIKEPVRVYKILVDTESSHKALVGKKLELPNKPSIAVLPFTNMSGDPSQEYFSDGLTEQVINGLCIVPELFVIARNSSFAYKGKTVSIKQIAKELGVKYILEGSVQRAGERVRITAQLIDALTDFHMWSETYDRDVEDIFALQDEITMKVISAMTVKLVSGDQAKSIKGIKNIKVIDKLFQSIESGKLLTKSDMKQAEIYCNEAIELDNTVAVSYSHKAVILMMQLVYGWTSSPLEALEQAEKCTIKALSLNDNLDAGHSVYGFLLALKKQYSRAIEEGEKAIEINPNSANAFLYLGFIYNCNDQPDLAIKHIFRAIRLDPFPNTFQYHTLAVSYQMKKEYRKTIGYCNKILAINPDNFQGHLCSASSYIFLDRIQEAYQAREHILRIDPHFSLNYYGMTLPYKNQEYRNSYLDALRKAGLPD